MTFQTAAVTFQTAAALGMPMLLTAPYSLLTTHLLTTHLLTTHYLLITYSLLTAYYLQTNYLLLDLPNGPAALDDDLLATPST